MDRCNIKFAMSQANLDWQIENEDECGGIDIGGYVPVFEGAWDAHIDVDLDCIYFLVKRVIKDKGLSDYKIEDILSNIIYRIIEHESLHHVLCCGEIDLFVQHRIMKKITGYGGTIKIKEMVN